MTEIFLVRHGQTAWNAGEVFRGQTDVDLDETGLKQAELLADYLSNRKIEAVFSSPLQRARKTAEAIARQQNIPVRISQSLNDISFGAWEGVPLVQVREKYPAEFNQWLNSPHLMRFHGGESLDDVAKRAMSLVQDVITKYQCAVVLTSHRVVHKILILAMLGLDNSHFWNIWLDTAAMTTFTYEHEIFILREHNNTSYLKVLEQPKLRDF